MKGLEKVSELPEDSALGVPTSENYRTTYWRRKNPQCVVGEDRYYPLHPNLPRHKGPKRRLYVIPYLPKKCELWMPAFQVADVDWFKAVTLTLDPVSVITGSSGQTPLSKKPQRIDFFPLHDLPEMIPPALRVGFQVTPKRLPEKNPSEGSMKFQWNLSPGPSLMFDLIQFCSSVIVDVIVIDYRCHNEFWCRMLAIDAKVMSTLTSAVIIFIDRELSADYAGPDHPVFGGSVLHNVVVARKLDASCLKGTNVVSCSHYSGAEQKYKEVLSSAKVARAWFIDTEAKGSAERIKPWLYGEGLFLYKNLLKPENNTKVPNLEEIDHIWRHVAVVEIKGEELLLLPYGIGQACLIVAGALDRLLGRDCNYGEVLLTMKMMGGYRPDLFGIQVPKDLLEAEPDLAISNRIKEMVKKFTGNLEPRQKKPSKKRPSKKEEKPPPQVPKGVGRTYRRQ